MTRPALEVADILRDHGPAWREANRGHVSLDQLKVMSAIERCRTAALGGHVARCENAACGHTLIAYNSCRNRHCPKCQAAASRRWLADREAELLPVPYFHVVYTLPSKLRDIAYQNKRVVYDLLMKAAAETTLAIAADPKRLGARIAITAVLHTWGSTLTHHPHVHMIVPGGGLSLDGARWVACRSNFLVHVNLLARLFSGKMLAMLTDAHNAGQLTFFNAHAGLADKKRFKRFLAPLRRIKWVVYCKAPFAGPKQVLRYLSRYTHRVAISNRRLVAADDAGVAFRWKDYRIDGPGRWKTMRLHPHEFIRRFLLHVLPKRLPPHPPLRALRQRQPRREHRDGPRMPRCRPARRRSAAEARCRARGAARAALPMPALRRTHDRHRGVRTRLRAEAAAGAERVRHIMSHTSSARRLPFLCARPRRAAISLDPIHGNQCARRPLIPSKSRLTRFSRSLARSRGQACRPPRSTVAAPVEPALASNRHSARRPTGPNLPATSCLDAFWTPAGCACGKSRCCRRPKTCTFAAVPDRSYERTECAKYRPFADGSANGQIDPKRTFPVVPGTDAKRQRAAFPERLARARPAPPRAGTRMRRTRLRIRQ